MEWVKSMGPDQIFLFIPIVAIVVWGAVTITKLYCHSTDG